MPRCKYCHQEILWFETESGKKMPVDREPEKRVVRFKRGEATIAKVVDTFMPHFKTCENYDQKRKQPKTPCRWCNGIEEITEHGICEKCLEWECHEDFRYRKEVEADREGRLHFDKTDWQWKIRPNPSDTPTKVDPDNKAAYAHWNEDAERMYYAEHPEIFGR